MPLKLEEAGFEDMKEIMEITFEAYNNPFDPYLDLIYPGLDPKTPPGYDKGLEQATERALEKWKATPRDVMVWIKIVDTDLSKIVAASRWVFHKGDSYAGGVPAASATWLPEGSKARAYAEFTMDYRADLYSQRCRRAHVLLGACFTHSAHRHRGAASMMVKWGLAKADEMGCESFVEASTLGQALYESLGFVFSGEVHNPRKPQAESDEEWKAVEDKWPLWFRWMWRPAKGSTWKKGMPFPWQEGKEAQEE